MTPYMYGIEGIAIAIQTIGNRDYFLSEQQNIPGFQGVARLAESIIGVPGRIHPKLISWSVRIPEELAPRKVRQAMWWGIRRRRI
jgi:hypothetical protein